MRLLISTCNHPKPVAANPEISHFLWEYNTQSFDLTPIPLHHPQLPQAYGVTGLARYRDGFVAMWQSPFPHLLYLSPNYRIQKVLPLTLTRDGHSLTVYDDTIWIASTGNDSVTGVHHRHGEFLVWRANTRNRDTIHLNSLVFWEGELLVSAFGKRTGSLWKGSQAGYVINITRNRVVRNHLAHPHSLVTRPEGIYLCESATKSVIGPSRKSLPIGRGYTRGLVITPSELCVGVSRQRKTSRSTGKVVEADTKGEFKPGKCGLVFFNIDKQEITACAFRGFMNLDPFAPEIYDVWLLEE